MTSADAGAVRCAMPCPVDDQLKPQSERWTHDGGESPSPLNSYSSLQTLEPPRRGAQMDKTQAAAAMQARTLGCDVVDVGIRNQASGTMYNRTWRFPQLLGAIAWLKRMNATGHDIFIRPGRNDASAAAWVLVDDLCIESIQAMREAGTMPSVVLETSSANYQVWVRFDAVRSDDHHRQIARALATYFNGDLRCAKPHQYGRLAGFTNRKPKHLTESGHPFVLLHFARRRVVTAASLETASVVTAQLYEAVAPAATTPDTKTYRRISDRLCAIYGHEVDWSRVDWLVATHFARRGYPPQWICAVLRDCSPELNIRKAGHVEDYLSRTVRKAVERTTSVRRGPLLGNVAGSPGTRIRCSQPAPSPGEAPFPACSQVPSRAKRYTPRVDQPLEPHRSRTADVATVESSDLAKDGR